MYNHSPVSQSSNGGQTEFAMLQATMQAIEFACSSIQMHANPTAAEETILSLSQSSRPYKACQFILENSQIPNARFQAAGAIREAAIREWTFLTEDERAGLISFCLSFAMQHASSPEGYVQAKVASVAAQLLKRGWLDLTSAAKENIFFQVKLVITGTHGRDVQFAGINFLESLVSEFSPSTSSAMGLPQEFHDKCCTSLELDYLKTFYTWAQEAAISVSSTLIASGSTTPEGRVCSAALRLMLQILNWDFKCNKSALGNGNRGAAVFSDGCRVDSYATSKTECNLVQPGPAWQDLLLMSGQVAWLLNLYGALRQNCSADRYWLDCPLAVSARKLIVQFCSLTGTLFPSDNGYMQGQHLLQLLSSIVEWMDPPDVVSKAIQTGKSESEFLDGCRALLAMATVTSPAVFDQLSKSIRPFGTIHLLSTLMCEVIKDLMETSTEEERWSCVARDILLDTWTVVLMALDGDGSLLPPEGAGAAANLFALIVECELKIASATAFGEEDGSDYLQPSVAAMDERLSSYALIARAAIRSTLPLLGKLFSERFTTLQQGRGKFDPTEILEELYSLLLITGHVLADEAQGETPLVPKAIQTQFTDLMKLEEHPVVMLSGSIMKFSEQSVDAEMRASFFSPRLMEAIVWFLARWSSTYLMSPEEIKENKSVSDPSKEVHLQSEHFKSSLLQVFGEHGQGKVVLDLLVRMSTTILVSYPGEKDLQALTCFQLLHGLARRRNVCAYLVTLDSWTTLATAFASDGVLLSLSGVHQRSVAQTLAVSSSGLKSSAEANQFIRNLSIHMTSYLLELSGRKDLKVVAQQPDIILLVSSLLERLRGVASASEPRIQKAIYEMGLSVMNPILNLLDIYKHESLVVYLLLKFVVTWVDGQISYLEAQETAAVIDFCVRLLQIYSSHNIGQISLSASSSLRNERDVEKCKDLRALLQLLASLCTKDLVDFSSAFDEVQGTSISQVVYMGLHIVTPLISVDLLKYPKLYHDYFSLLSHLLEVYPEMIVHLNNEALAHIVGTLDFGLHHQDAEVVDYCLRALKALASYHYKETGSGKVGLASYALDHEEPAGNVQEGILSRFLRTLLKVLLFEDYGADLVSSAADALLPLILCQQSLYQRLGNELIERQGDANFKSRLANAFQSLTSSNNISSTLDRSNYQRFRKNVHSFLVEVRGFLRTK